MTAYEGLHGQPLASTTEQERREKVCGSDAAVVGVPTSRRILLNDTNTALITVYEITVSRWIKPASGTNTVTAGLRAGKVLVNNYLYETLLDQHTIVTNEPHFFVLHRIGVLKSSYFIRSASVMQNDRLLFDGLEGQSNQVLQQIETMAASCNPRRERK